MPIALFTMVLTAYIHVVYSVCNKVHKENLCCILHPLCDWERTMCLFPTSSSLHTCRPSLTRCMRWLTLTYQWASRVFVSTCVYLCSYTFELWLLLPVLHYFTYISVSISCVCVYMYLSLFIHIWAVTVAAVTALFYLHCRELWCNVYGLHFCRKNW